MIATRTRIGPDCHGELVPLDALGQLDYEPGFAYEIIDGRWYVAPVPNAPEGYVNDWIFARMYDYSRLRPDVVNHVTGKCRVFVPDRAELTVPEPDLGVYADFPHGTPIRDLDWAEVSPLVVVEVLVDGDPRKDLVRNRDLYLAVPSITEYWVLDGRADPDRPTLIAHRRWGNRWVVRETAFGDTYTTRHLPGFELIVDPRQ